MGNKHSSKQENTRHGSVSSLNTSGFQSFGSFKRTRSLPTKLNKSKSIYDFDVACQYLIAKTSTFNSTKNDPKYSEIIEEIARVSKDLQEYRRKLRIDSEKYEADNIQKSLSDCMSNLVRKAQENEANSSSDIGVVDTNSIIVQNYRNSLPKQQPPQKVNRPLPEPPKSRNKPRNRQKNNVQPSPKYHKRMQPLHAIEVKVQDLKSDVDTAILQRNEPQFGEIESRIKSVCRDLELVETENHTPLYEKKEQLYTALIKYNKSIRRARRKLQRETAVDIPDQQNANNPEMNAIEKEITMANLQRMAEPDAIEEHKQKYTQILEKLEAVNDTSIADTKNNSIIEVKAKLKDIELQEFEMELQTVQQEVMDFSDYRESQKFVQLDQKLLQMWDKVSRMKIPSYKERFMVKQIQEALYLLNKNCLKPTESKTEGTLYQNKEVVQQHPLVNGTSQTSKIIKPPLPTPREQTPTENDLKAQLDEYLKQIDEIKNKINHKKPEETEEIDVRSQLSNVSSNINDLLERLAKESEKSASQSVHDYPTQFKDEVNARKSQNVPTEVVVHLEPIRRAPEKPMNDINDTNGNDEIYTTPAESVNDYNTSQFEGDGKSTVSSNVYPSIEDKTTYKTDVGVLQENLHVKTASISKASEEGEYTASVKSSEIKELGEQLDNNTTYYNFTGKKKSTNKVQETNQQEQLTNELDDIKNITRKMYSEVQNFEGISKDINYERIQTNLNRCLSSLTTIDAYAYNDIERRKSNLSREIQNCLDNLDNKLLKNQEEYRKTRNSLKEIADKLHGLKKRIDGFAGAYKNVLYVQIESELIACLDHLKTLKFSGDSKLTHAVAQAKQKNEQYLKILEQKSVKSHEFRHSKSNSVELSKTTSEISPSEAINNARQELLKIKDDAEVFSETSDHPGYSTILKNLEKCREDLRNIQDHGRSSVKVTKEQYLNYTVELQQYIEQKAQQAKYYQENRKQDMHQQLIQAENDLEKLSRQVDGFSGSASDPLYTHLDEKLIQIQIIVDKLPVAEGNKEIEDRKMSLSKNIHRYSKILNEKVGNLSGSRDNLQAEKLENVKEEIKKIYTEIENIDGPINEAIYDMYNDMLVDFFIRTENADATTDKQRQMCKEDIFKARGILTNKFKISKEVNQPIKFFTDLDGVQI